LIDQEMVTDLADLYTLTIDPLLQLDRMREKLATKNTANHELLTRNNTLINSLMLEAARLEGVERYLYTSSACVYLSFLQSDADVTPLLEEKAAPETRRRDTSGRNFPQSN